jgi:hydrogenase-4 component B
MFLDVTFGEICGLGLHFCVDGFRLVYLVIACIMWGCAGIFSREYMAHYQNKSRYYIFFWATFAATVGVFLSANLYTTFIFFEIMSFTSYVWVAFDEKPESLRAAETYLAVAVIGGLVMLMGLFLLQDLFGTLEMSELGEKARAVLALQAQSGSPAALAGQASLASQTQFSCAMGNPVVQLYTAAALMLFGFGAKAGCLPLHIWLPKAHPVAPAPASALLSGILTKAGIFGIILVSCVMLKTSHRWGLLITILGLATMFWGALLAVFSINLKKTLACSSVSQIGFILTGIGTSVLLAAAGEEPALSVHGAFLHMCNHSMFKLVLFLCAGVVYMNLHELDLNRIRGFGRGKKMLMFAYLMGALGIGGIPLWSGYVSKTLLHEGIVEYIELLAEEGAWVIGWKAGEWVFLVTGGMTVAYMLKLFFALFIEKNEDAKRQEAFDKKTATYIRPESAAAVLLPAVLLPVCGMFPSLTMDKIAALGQQFFGLEETGHAVHYFALANLKGGLISIGIGIVLYIVVIRGCLMENGAYVDRWPSWMDLENTIYRPVITKALPAVCGFVCGLIDRYCISAPLTVCMEIARVVCRSMDHLTDGLILLARKTTHSQIPSAHPHLHSERRQHAEDTIQNLAESLRHNGMLVEESFSFGLIMAVAGLCMTLVFLLIVFLR